MVSFFGIKFGEKKRDGGGKKKKGRDHDDDELFGPKGDNAMMGAPYFPGGHNFAASSMVNLTSGGPGNRGSFSSLKAKPNASDVNLRARFAKNNGSSASLVAPSPAFGPRAAAKNRPSSGLASPGPGFGSRLGTKNSSAINLALPPVGLGPRPATASGKAQDWPSPADRSLPVVPLTPKSPPALDIQLPPTPKGDGDTDSVFGEEADDMVDTIMASVEEKLAKEKALAAASRKVAERQEKEHMELRSRTTAQRPPAAHIPQQSWQANDGERQPRGPMFQGAPEERPGSRGGVRSPVFRGNADDRPSSRGGVRSPVFQGAPEERPGSRGGVRGPVFMGNPDERPGSRNGRPNGPPPMSRGPQMDPSRPGPAYNLRVGPHGPPRHGPPTQDLPQPPSRTGHRRGPRGESPGPLTLRALQDTRGPSLDGHRPGFQSSNLGAPRSFSPNPAGQRSQSPAYMRSAADKSGLLPRGQGLQGYRSESPTPISPISPSKYSQLDEVRTQSPSTYSHPSRGNMNENRSQSPAPSSRGPYGYSRQESGSTMQSMTSTGPSLRELMAQSPEPQVSHTRSTSVSSHDSWPIEQFAKPIIQSVQARRDTFTLNTPRRHSLSMEIEELEKSLMVAQQIQITPDPVRSSYSSSHYSDDSDYTPEPTVTLQPAPQRASPEAPVYAPQELSPIRGRQALRRGPRRPTLDEYNVSNTQLAPARVQPSPIELLSPLTRAITPQYRALAADPTPPRQTSPTNFVDTGFKFDFGPPPVMAPPTPDSATWPLATSPSPDPALSPTPEPIFPNPLPRSSAAPAPLTFNFSPDAYSRDPALWTPPPPPPPRSASRTPSLREPVEDAPPPISKTGAFLAAAPPPFNFNSPINPPSRSRTPVDGVNAGEAAAAAAALGIGMARGPSMRVPVDRRARLGRVDAFGTDFI
ncbi:hypothetical protein B0T18DRAFT_99224 [Schizothecium vesticola]|uniref:Uncharacterized protein n=1 Tax=Schizothecium vesticola TaxID=314040 RepID=A0AA40F1C7_9PEZI|nr:hypothetical protein B0T18DRAFT_99224 [Schizothecium vesticola]